MDKKFELKVMDKEFEFNPNRSFDERCDIVRSTSITSDMTFEQRLSQLRRRFGL